MSLPNIKTVSDVLKDFIYIDNNGNKTNFSAAEQKKLLRLRLNGEDMFSLQPENYLNDLLSLFSELDFDEAYKYLSTLDVNNKKETVFDSLPFSVVKKSNYINLISELN